MDQKKLLQKAMWNSGLLAVMFTSTTAQSFAQGNVLFGIVGVLATIFTAKDAITLYHASQENK